ncbi:hypothetical protein DSO57_1003955 [Entomophthora muscae]|uniref:Uncharacterized protein n=1 Tax=Entomophthora muscae TaxID=34485 RepID=A0ACC2RZC2_9FUNG|nr:hypothetical protein DSO57_1003955 [Entomophthora muscae]
MVFNSNIFNGASSQDSSSQASFNGGKAQNVDEPVYTQAFEAGNKEADLYLTPDPYGFDLFSSHTVSSSAPAPVPTPIVVNTAIHHVLILPLVGHFKDKSLAFAFAS